MKRLSAIFGLVGLLVFQACEGPMGPPGPPGLDGQDGVTIVGEAFQVEVDFNATNDYSELFEFDPPIVESDVVLVFLRWESEGNTPIWRALPQTVYFQEGILVYNYDFSRLDFRVFLDGAIDFELLGDDWTQNQLFRVIVVPADFAGSRIDFTNYEAVTNLMGLEEKDFLKLVPKASN